MNCLRLAAWLSVATLSYVFADDFHPPILALDSPAPDFNLPGVDGRNHKLKDFADAKVLVVVFTCNHCPTAQYYEERVKELARDYKDRGVAMVAIMPNDPKSVRLDELGWTDLSDSFEEIESPIAGADFHFFKRVAQIRPAEFVK